jgi:uncharacterized protein (TIGR03435 family)
MSRWIPILTMLASLFATALVYAQSPANARPEFGIASVKPVPLPPPSGGGPWTVDHGRFIAQTGYVRGVIGWAYDILASQVRGGPDWLDREPYDFEAKADNPNADENQIRAMIQTLLADRFKLAVHRQTQEAQVYTLVVGKNGSKMQEAKEGSKNYINWTGMGQVAFTECNMLGLINVLSGMLASPVLDKTGLEGLYNFKLEFTDPRFPPPKGGSQLSLESRPDIFTAVQEQLGLRLESTKGPVEFLVIDHVERPSGN